MDQTREAAAEATLQRSNRSRKATVDQLLAPWEEFRRVIPLVSLKSLLHPATSFGAQGCGADVHDARAALPGPAAQLDCDPDAPGMGHLGFGRRLRRPYARHPRVLPVALGRGPPVHPCRACRRGSTANFLSLTCRADIEADYFAYADQDDVWEADKLERAVDWLKTVPEDVPALYGSRTLLVDARNQHIGYSPLFERAPDFRNALVQSIAGGNTMVFNRAARDLLRRAGEQVEAITHDWWAYMLVTSCGGRVHYDSHPTVRYRQHGHNQFGANADPIAQLRRAKLLLQGRFRGWVDANLRALQRVRHLMTPENQQVLDEFSLARQRWLGASLVGLRRSGIFRQTTVGNLGLLAGRADQSPVAATAWQAHPVDNRVMSSVAASTAAVIVAYHPRQDLTPLLQSLRMAVGRVVVVDNSCPPHAALPDWAAAAGALWLGAGNVGGLAGAYNKALALLQTDAAVRHVVFVDEDSDTSVLRSFLWPTAATPSCCPAPTLRPSRRPIGTAPPPCALATCVCSAGACPTCRASSSMSRRWPS
jgi:hypothetical protein